MGDFNGRNYKDSFIGDLVDFVAGNILSINTNTAIILTLISIGDDFQTMFEKFFLTHALEFTNDEEHKLIYYEIYQEFHDLFEKQLGIILRDIICNSNSISSNHNTYSYSICRVSIITNVIIITLSSLSHYHHLTIIITIIRYILRW